MNIKLILDIEEFRKIKEDWVTLFNLAEYSVFQSFEFNFASWQIDLSRNKQNQLSIILLKKNNDSYAVLPLYIDSSKRLRFINDSHSDFCDFISLGFFDVPKVLAFLKEKIYFSSVKLTNIKIESNVYKSVVSSKILNKVLTSKYEYSTLDIDKGIFPYNVPFYRSHEKHRINKAIRKHKDKKACILDHRKDTFPKEEILYLRDRMINLGFRKYNFLTDQRLLLIEYLYNSGFLIIHSMTHKDTLVACNFILKREDNKFLFWIDLFDDIQMINISSYIAFMKSVSLQYPVFIDFGRGRYFYKTSNFKPTFSRLYQIDIFFTRWTRLNFIFWSKITSFLLSIYRKKKR